MRAAPRTPTRKRRSILINRPFALLWYGQTISNLGDTVIGAALVLWVGGTLARGFGWVALAVAGVLAAQYLPQVLVAPIAGVFVDRWDRRVTMLRMDAFRALLIGALTALAFLSNIPRAVLLVAVYVAIFTESVAAQFFNPSRLALIGAVVPEETYAQATGLSQAAFGLSVLIGPAIAAPLVVDVGAAWALLIDAFSFVFSFVMLLQVRPLAGSAGFAANQQGAQEETSARAEQPVPPSAQAPLEHGVEGLRGVWADLRAGLALLGRSRVLLALAAGTVLSNVGLGAVIALAYFFVTENLHASPQLFGFVSTTFGLGAILGALLTALWARRLGEERVLVGGLLLMGLTMAALGRATSPVLALSVACAFGAMLAAVQVVTGPLILRGAPSAYVGRVSSALTPLGSLATLIGIGVSGALLSGPLQGLDFTFLAQHFGPVDTCFTLAGVVVFVGGMYAAALLRSEPQASLRVAASADQLTESASTTDAGEQPSPH